MKTKDKEIALKECELKVLNILNMLRVFELCGHVYAPGERKAILDDLTSAHKEMELLDKKYASDFDRKIWDYCSYPQRSIKSRLLDVSFSIKPLIFFILGAIFAAFLYAVAQYFENIRTEENSAWEASSRVIALLNDYTEVKGNKSGYSNRGEYIFGAQRVAFGYKAKEELAKFDINCTDVIFDFLRSSIFGISDLSYKQTYASA